ncbi:LysE family translocator [Pseudoalteromonas sp. KAN5]|uniref:LysE family translocator n=1 Tax=Pseudoalteromonas sp. KAN5 TaxID=2916633 RepID=UPI001FCC536C|nr:LysE family translocator [Pseudoalteromonas sp. KAN5]BDF93877.1 lysine transporter LysE [Pseudoalteromonas sp. KAN5]
MTFSVIISMALFALAASITPGPVNLLSLSCSARFGARSGLLFVTGATLGFIVLFLFIGFSLHLLIDKLAWITSSLQWFGIAFLLYLSYQLFIDGGTLDNKDSRRAPTFMTGVIMQWLNPKAWLASLSGIAAYIPSASSTELVAFASVYLPICWLSLACWVLLGMRLGQHFQSAANVRLMNKALALLLVASCVLLVI